VVFVHHFVLLIGALASQYDHDFALICVAQHEKPSNCEVGRLRAEARFGSGLGAGQPT
jgi:hypothetical protein